MRSGTTLPGRMALLAFALASLLALSMLCGCKESAPAHVQSSSIDTVAMDKQAIREGIDKELGVLKSPTAQELEGVLAPENCEMASHLLRDFSYEIVEIDVAQDKANAKLQVTCLDVSGVVDKGIASLSTEDELNKNAQMYDSPEEEEHKKFARHILETLYEQIDVTTAKKTYGATLRLTRDAKTNVWSVDESDVRALIDGLFSI